jgi:retron-type reverse transcriptase
MGLARRVRSSAALRKAWRHVRRSALASDATDVRQEAERFEARWDSELRSIQGKLARQTYRFAEAQGIVKERRGKTSRPIVVAPVRDRVVQRAILETVIGVESVSKAVVTPWSFGGHPRIGVPKAIRAACHSIAGGSEYFLTTDIAGFFTKIPRKKALARLQALLPEDSLSHLLDEATTVELANPLFLKDDRKLFPTYELGVAQGCCLSPLLGNVLLGEFDAEVGGIDGVQLLRYIDDVLILGPDRQTVRRAFRVGRAILKRLGFEFYDPGDASGKAAEGSTRRGFTYLGCVVSPGYVIPSDEAVQRAKDRIQLRFKLGRIHLNRGDFRSPEAYQGSLLDVLLGVSHVVRGWSNQYAFCNADRIMAELDAFVDDELRKYLGFYSDRRSRQDAYERRRMLGVRLFVDGKRDPILPLNRVE